MILNLAGLIKEVVLYFLFSYIFYPHFNVHVVLYLLLLEGPNKACLRSQSENEQITR